VPGAAIKASRLNVSPLYKRAQTNKQPQLLGYRVNHVLTVLHTNIYTAAGPPGAMVEQGANVLSGVRLMSMTRRRCYGAHAHSSPVPTAAGGHELSVDTVVVYALLSALV